MNGGLSDQWSIRCSTRGRQAFSDNIIIRKSYMSKMDPSTSSVTSNLRVNLRWIAVVLLLHLRYPTGLCSVVQPETRSVVQNDEIPVETVTSKGISGL